MANNAMHAKYVSQQAFRIWNIWPIFQQISVHKLFNWKIWVLMQQYPVQISGRDIQYLHVLILHSIDDESVDEALYSQYSTLDSVGFVLLFHQVLSCMLPKRWNCYSKFTCQCRWKVQDKPSAWHPWKDLRHRGPSWGKERLFYDLYTQWRIGHTVLSN